MNRGTARMTLAAMLAVTTSCSFATTTGAPSRPDPRVEPTCTTSRGSPIADLAITLVITGLSIRALAAKPTCDSEGVCDPYESQLSNGLGTLGILVAVPFGISTLVGFGRTSSCRDAVRAHRTWQATQPAPLAPPPPGPPGATP